MSRDTYSNADLELQRETPQERHEATGCLLRVYWMLLGNVLVFLLAYGIAMRGVYLTRIDLAYWLAAASLPLVKFIDIRFMRGTTADGAPATMSHWRRYTLMVMVITFTLWLAAHGIGFLIG